MEKKKLYFAAPLFNLADKFFNASLSEALSDNFDVTLPQRSGFEFSKLREALVGKVDDYKIEDVVNHLIYYLDVGFLLPNCDFCVARLDDPVDEGVVSEIGHSRKMRIPIIGYRTDCRTPYGSSCNEVRGAHFFPPYDCDAFVNFTSGKNETAEKASNEISKLAELIGEGCERVLTRYHGRLPVKDVNLSSGFQYVGNELFRGLNETLHSPDALNEVVRRYSLMIRDFDLSPLKGRIINA